MKARIWWLAGMLGIAVRPAAAATVTCIDHNDSAALLQALVQAQYDISDVTIKVEQGTYLVDVETWIFTLQPGTNLELLGGYKPGTGCSDRQITASPSTPATNTVLDGQGKGATIIQFTAQARSPTSLPTGSITIEGFEIRNLVAAPYSNALTLTWNPLDGFNGGIHFRYNWVHGNAANSTVVELSAAGNIDVINNLVTANSGPYTLSVGSGAGHAPMHIVHNTVAANTGYGLALYRPDGDALLLNNVLQGNGGGDLGAGGAVHVSMLSETYGVATTSGTASLDKFAYTQTNSPQYDVNTFHPTVGNNGGAYAALLPTQDLDGNPRVVGSRPDRGAFETGTNDQAHFVVTSTLDESQASLGTVNCDSGSPTCTLREAIIRANAAGPATIDFALGNACLVNGPYYILAGSRLPEIKYPLRINGYSQAGADANMASKRLCVVVQRKAAASVDFALWASDVANSPQLDVSGIRFEGFSSSAIYLATGAYHWIHGNSFAVAPIDSPFVLGNGKGVTLATHTVGAITKNALFTTIGGADMNADANFFGKMNQSFGSAVFLNAAAWAHVGSTVRNNLIGIGIDLQTPLPNAGYGIQVKDSDYNEIAGNFIAASAKEGIDLWTASSNWLHGNRIGVSPKGPAAALGNGGSGIIVTYASANNAIGEPDVHVRNVENGNAILGNHGAGVWIWSGAGAGNVVLDNYIGLNGPSGSPVQGGLAIDLGPAGAGLGSTNIPNDAQQAPTLLESYALGGDYLVNFALSGTGGETYRIDVHYNGSGSCDVSGYGPALFPEFARYVTLAGAGAQTQDFGILMPGGMGLPASVAATATRVLGNDTSEISNCLIITTDDRIFADAVGD